MTYTVRRTTGMRIGGRAFQYFLGIHPSLIPGKNVGVHLGGFQERCCCFSFALETNLIDTQTYADRDPTLCQLGANFSES